MVLRLINYVIIAIVALYVLEGAGVIEKRKYFPTLPRLEASAGDPYAWLGAAQWGISRVSSAAQGKSGGSSFDTGSLDEGNVLERFANQHREIQRYLNGGGYGG